MSIDQQFDAAMQTMQKLYFRERAMKEHIAELEKVLLMVADDAREVGLVEGETNAVLQTLARSVRGMREIEVRYA